jgi:hypothetical protein
LCARARSPPSVPRPLRRPASSCPTCAGVGRDAPCRDHRIRPCRRDRQSHPARGGCKRVPRRRWQDGMRSRSSRWPGGLGRALVAQHEPDPRLPCHRWQARAPNLYGVQGFTLPAAAWAAPHQRVEAGGIMQRGVLVRPAAALTGTAAGARCTAAPARGIGGGGRDDPHA